MADEGGEHLPQPRIGGPFERGSHHVGRPLLAEQFPGGLLRHRDVCACGARRGHGRFAVNRWVNSVRAASSASPYGRDRTRSAQTAAAGEHGGSGHPGHPVLGGASSRPAGTTSLTIPISYARRASNGSPVSRFWKAWCRPRVCSTGTEAIIGQAPWLDSVVPSRAPSTATTSRSRRRARTRHERVPVDRRDDGDAEGRQGLEQLDHAGSELHRVARGQPRAVDPAAEDIPGAGQDHGRDVRVLVRGVQRVEQAGHQARVQRVGVRVVERDPRGVASPFGANAFHDRSDPFVEGWSGARRRGVAGDGLPGLHVGEQPVGAGPRCSAEKLVTPWLPPSNIQSSPWGIASAVRRPFASASMSTSAAPKITRAGTVTRSATPSRVIAWPARGGLLAAAAEVPDVLRAVERR